MNKTPIEVPKGIEYLSQIEDFELPNGILNKGIPNCGATTTATTAIVETISQADGIVWSVNQATMDDVENLGLMRLWTNPPIDGSYVYDDVQYQQGFYIENLQPATTYYYRIVRQATSSVGNDVTEYKIMYGDVYSFTTKESNNQ